MFITSFVFFFFNDTATTEIYTLSLHDALPISAPRHHREHDVERRVVPVAARRGLLRQQGRHPSLHRKPVQRGPPRRRSEEHTSELQSRSDLVCRLLLEKKKKRYGLLYH